MGSLYDWQISILAVLALSMVFPVASAVPLAGQTQLSFAIDPLQNEFLLLDDGPPPAQQPREAKRGIVDESATSVIAAMPVTAAYGAHKAEVTSLMTDTSQQPTVSLPTPFDTSLGNNFTTTSCPAFFSNFLSNSSFSACYPLSLLLQVGQIAHQQTADYMY